MTTVHVYPLGDVVGHVIDGDDCPCGPSVELLDGVAHDGWLVVHHSLDGREHAETGPT